MKLDWGTMTRRVKWPRGCSIALITNQSNTLNHARYHSASRSLGRSVVHSLARPLGRSVACSLDRSAARPFGCAVAACEAFSKPLICYTCMYVRQACMYVCKACMYVCQACMYVWEKSCSGDEVRFLTKTFTYLTFNSTFWRFVRGVL